MKKRSATTLCRALPDYYRSGLFSDVKLLFFDNSGGAGQSRPTGLEIKMHKFVLYSGAVPVLTRLIDRNHYNDLRSDDTIHLELNFSEFDEATVRFFFGLIYHNKLSQALAESPEMNATLDENILHLHQLAGYFGFVALLAICQDRMYRCFSADTVNQLSAYCLHPLNGQTGHYFVPEEKHTLYTKLLHWYQLCVDDAAPDALFAAGGGGEYSPRCKSNKTVVIGQKKKYVENFSRFQLPPAGAVAGSTGELHHYRRVCVQCVRNPRLVHKKENAVINMGSVGAWSFSMTHKLVDNVNMMLFLKHQSTTSASSSSEENDDHMSVESSSSGECVRLQCRVGLFSQRDDGLSGCSEETLETSNNLSELTRVACVKLHSEDDCYESVCDCCRRTDPVFIFCISVNIIK